MKFIVDTHALIWFLEGNCRLGTQAKAILSTSESRLVLPAIAFAEAVWIVERGKTSIPSVASLLNAVSQDPRLIIYPLDQAVIEQTIQLSDIAEMHDRQIVATGLVIQGQGESVALLTCDQNILAANLLKIIW